jgi:hypothetical protein
MQDPWQRAIPREGGRRPSGGAAEESAGVGDGEEGRTSARRELGANGASRSAEPRTLVLDWGCTARDGVASRQRLEVTEGGTRSWRARGAAWCARLRLGG